MSDNSSTSITDWVPAFPGQRPPFTPGHTKSLRHGYWSPRKVEPVAQELVDMVHADPSLAYLTEQHAQPALWAWAQAEARVQLMTAHLEKVAEDGVGDLGDRRITEAWNLLHRAETRAESGRRRLGLDPLSRARLGKDVAQGRQADAAAALTAMREDIERMKGQTDDE